MGKIKYLLFVFLVLIITLFPLFEQNPKKKEGKTKNDIIPTIIYKGIYYFYENNLTKYGNFTRLEIFKNKLLVDNLYLNNLIEKYKLFSKKAEYTKPIIKGFDVKYINDEYNLTTNFAIYNQKSKILKGKKFKVHSTNYKGFGDSFKVDKDKNIYATNIKYFIKVDK
ncbi:hypothetical protein FE773_06095 [Caminibacter mediatlanticus TB-2]|uniref:LPS export ABC transporter periplasmic protein LptC n=1 Tax=Caminibacter mediatlanticus TB-2 TaxID=391592 RepID=A0AAI9AHT0_9BACT|nr:hypothetical protein [Caminibacter mediatlanticus]EDM23866.1 hypothetical protein CMTB2_01324 [Caminibacter mediatlanticus TB-2]QCT94765.1 hypothetical protein FE773_06095 [Caminibacter mediatlanticus TB-2]